jgi:hypothetical protein
MREIQIVEVLKFHYPLNNWHRLFRHGPESDEVSSESHTLGCMTFGASLVCTFHRY